MSDHGYDPEGLVLIHTDCELCDEVEANRCYFCGVSDPSHNPEDCADLAQWERELLVSADMKRLTLLLQFGTF